METHGIMVHNIRVLRGPNLYAYMPVLQIVMDIGPYDDRPSHSFPGFIDRLIQWLPDLQSHQCSLGRLGGFIQRLQRGTYLPHICEHVTLELQTLMGFDVTFGRVRGTGESGAFPSHSHPALDANWEPRATRVWPLSKAHPRL